MSFIFKSRQHEPAYSNQNLRHDAPTRRATRPSPPAPTRSASCFTRRVRATSRPDQAAPLIAAAAAVRDARSACSSMRRRTRWRPCVAAGAGLAAAIPRRRNARTVRAIAEHVRRPFVARAYRRTSPTRGGRFARMRSCNYRAASPWFSGLLLDAYRGCLWRRWKGFRLVSHSKRTRASGRFKWWLERTQRD